MLEVDHILGRAGRVFGPGWSKNADLQEVVKLRARRHVRRLRDLSRVSSVEKVRGRAYHALRSYDARFCAIILSWKKGSGHISLGALEAMADELDARQDCGEIVSGRIEDKTNGWRPICAFGRKRRALQRLALDILEAAWGSAPYEYSRRGRGRDAALTALRTAVKTGGAPWFLTSDISACFRSFDRNKMIEMIPLPKAVVEYCLFVPEVAIIHVTPNKHLDKTASEIAVRQGIPQGSLSSSFVVAKLLEPVLDQLHGVVVLSHGDDIAVASRTKVEAQTNQHALAALLEQHPAGPLNLKSNKVAVLGTPIDFLGYRLRRGKKKFGDGPTRLTPSPAAFAKYEPKLTAVLLQHGLDDLEVACDEWTKQWQGGYPLWDRSEAGDFMVWDTAHQWVIPYVRKVLKKSHPSPFTDPFKPKGVGD